MNFQTFLATSALLFFIFFYRILPPPHFLIRALNNRQHRSEGFTRMLRESFLRFERQPDRGRHCDHGPNRRG